jgi:hypothetical protein
MKLKLGDLVMEEPPLSPRGPPPEIGIIVEIESPGWNVGVLIGDEIQKIAFFYLKLLSPGDALTPSEG